VNKFPILLITAILAISCIALAGLHFLDLQSNTDDSATTPTLSPSPMHQTPSPDPQTPIPSPTPTPASDVKITDITSGSGWKNYSGVAMDYLFNITVYNGGSSDIKGLTLEANITGVTDDIFDCKLYGYGVVIHPGESVDLIADIGTNLDNVSKLRVVMQKSS